MKIGIVGTGMVGATAAYAFVMSGVGREIVLVDLNPKRSLAEAQDITHAVPFANPLRITSGKYEDLVGCKVVIVAAGVGQKPGETRLQLLERNAAVFAQVIPAILHYAPDTILIVATNPVDIMTHMAAHFAAKVGLPKSRVIGSGTTLDTARFRSLVGELAGVDSYHVHGYVVGEHGDSEVVLWSQTHIGSVPLTDFCLSRNIDLNQEKMDDISLRVRKAAYTIIEGKGATYYGIGSALVQISRVILKNETSLLTICSPQEEIAGVKNVTVSMPVLFNADGVLDMLPIPMNEHEYKQLNQSATVVKSAIESIQLD